MRYFTNSSAPNQILQYRYLIVQLDDKVQNRMNDLLLKACQQPHYI